MQCRTKKVWLIADPSYGQIIVNEEDFDSTIHTTTKPGKAPTAAKNEKPKSTTKPEAKDKEVEGAKDKEQPEKKDDSGKDTEDGPTARERAKGGLKPVTSETTEIS